MANLFEIAKEKGIKRPVNLKNKPPKRTQRLAYTLKNLKTEEETGRKRGENREINPEKLALSSSSYITTTTETDKNNTLINIALPHEIIKIGFGKNHLRQIENMGDLTVKDISESLEHFAYDLENGNLKIRTNPVGFLMGIFRKGSRYTSSHYAEELEADITGHLAELEKREKERQDKKQRVEQLLFEEWADKKSDEELQSIVTSPTGEARGQMHMQMLKGYFVEKEMTSFKENFSSNR